MGRNDIAVGEQIPTGVRIARDAGKSQIAADIVAPPSTANPR